MHPATGVIVNRIIFIGVTVELRGDVYGRASDASPGASLDLVDDGDGVGLIRQVRHREEDHLFELADALMCHGKEYNAIICDAM